MAGPQSRVEQLPEDIRPTALQLMDTLKSTGATQSQCDIVMRAIVTLSKNEIYRTALQECLVRLGNSVRVFKPLTAQVISAVVENSGKDGVAALNALSGILVNPKTNSSVLSSIAIICNVIHQNTLEGLYCLNSLINNPNFTNADIANPSFSTKVGIWIASTLKESKQNGKDALSALSSLFSNQNFKPEDLYNERNVVRIAKTIGLAAKSEHRLINDLDMLRALFQNPAITPSMVDAKLSGDLWGIINEIEKKVAKWDSEGMDVGIAGPLLMAILLNPNIKRSDLAPDGLVPQLITKSGKSSEYNLKQFQALIWEMKDSSALEVARVMVSSSKELPNGFLLPLLRMSKTPEAIPLIKGNEKRLAQLILQTINLTNDFNARTQAVEALGRILNAWKGDDRILGFLEKVPKLAGDMSIQVLFAISLYNWGDGTKIPEDSFITNLASACNIVWAGEWEWGFQQKGLNGLRAILSHPTFDPKMLEDGLIAKAIKASGGGPKATETVDTLAIALASTFGDGPQVLKILGMIIDQSGKNSESALKSFSDFAADMPNVPGSLDSLERILPLCRDRCDLVLPLWGSFIKEAAASRTPATTGKDVDIKNPRIEIDWSALDSYAKDIVNLAFLAAGSSVGTQKDAIAVLSSIIYPSFEFGVGKRSVLKPSDLASLQYAVRMSGRNSLYVLKAIKNQLYDANNPIPPEIVFSKEYLSSLVSLFNSLADATRPKEVLALGLLADSLGNIQAKPKEMANYLSSMRDKVIEMAKRGEDRYVIAAYLPLWCNPRWDPRLKTEERKVTARISQIIGSYSGKDKEEMAKSVGEFLRSFPEVSILTMIDNESFEVGKALAGLLIHPPPKDLTTIANFAYAVKTIGAEKAARLYNELGIEYFFRYSKDTLEAVYANMFLGAGANKPVFIAVMTKDDWNGAFYHQGRLLDSLLSKYRVVIAETDNEEGFYAHISKVGKTLKRPKGLLIGGHGSPETIRLGAGNDEKYTLDLGDKEELSKLKDLLEPAPTIVLDACSTGFSHEGIGSLISSSVADATLFAPEVPTAIKSLDAARDGRISVEYYKSSAQFFSGRKVGR